MGRDDSLFRRLIDEGDAPDAPRRVLVEEQGDRAIITLCEPERLNVLSAPLVRQLRRAVADLSESPDIRTIILTGAGPGFCAGGDLQMMDTCLLYTSPSPRD